MWEGGGGEVLIPSVVEGFSSTDVKVGKHTLD